MATGEHTETASASDLQALSHAAEALDEGQARIGARFRRAEVRRRVRRFREGLLAPVERKNGWQLAEAIGERGPPGVQRWLVEAAWDQEAARDELRSYVLAHVGETADILVVDETGCLKKGKQSAGVAPQYSGTGGTAGGRANCQIGVFLLSARPKGAAFIERELYLPDAWTQDRVRCREAGIPDAVGLATKGERAQRMLARAFTAGVQAAWAVGDSISGSDELRTWLEGQQQPYVLAVAETHPVWMAGRALPVGLVAALLPVGLVAALLPEEAWTPLSAGAGSQGQPRATAV
jgi:SRSO17 transposase